MWVVFCSFIILSFAFRFVMHFELIFMKGIGLNLDSFFLHVDVQLFQTIFSLPLSGNCIYAICFWALCLFFLLLACSFTSATVSCLLLYTKSWSWIVSVLQLPSSSSILCWLLWVFGLCINFRISLSISLEITSDCLLIVLWWIHRSSWKELKFWQCCIFLTVNTEYLYLVILVSPHQNCFPLYRCCTYFVRFT